MNITRISQQNLNESLNNYILAYSASRFVQMGAIFGMGYSIGIGEFFQDGLKFSGALIFGALLRIYSEKKLDKIKSNLENTLDNSQN